MEDGRALRELREALPEASGGFFVTYDHLLVNVPGYWTARLAFTDRRHEGPTIAEAADSCRAALVTTCGTSPSGARAGIGSTA